MNKMIYVLNHYSSSDSTHFYHIINLLNKVAESGIKICVVIEKADSAPKFNNQNIEVIIQKKKNKILRLLEFFYIARKLIKNDYRKVFIRISTIPTIIFIILSWFSHIETFYWHSGTIFDSKNKSNFSLKSIKKAISDKKFTFIKKYVHNFVTGPELMVNYYAQYAKVPKSKIKLLYNDIDIERFKNISKVEKQRLREQLNLPSDKRIILFVKRLSPIKKPMYYLPYIIEEFNHKYSDATFVIIGYGAEQKKLEQYLENNKSLVQNVIFLGTVPNKEVQNYYMVSDIFLNVTAEEGFPRVLLESMASGMAVISTNVGGIKNILGKEQSKFIFEPDDRDGIVEGLLKLSNNENEIDILSNENQLQSQKYSTTNVSKMFINLIFGAENEEIH
jgi:glycosyltransferase involved in cell wall biosynthesis